jgi:hypothetical protein
VVEHLDKKYRKHMASLWLGTRLLGCPGRKLDVGMTGRVWLVGSLGDAKDALYFSYE